MNDRGLLSSLFDFSFTHFVAPKLWKILYVLLLGVGGLGAIMVLVTMLGIGSGFFGKMGGLIIGIPLAGLFFLLAAIYFRVILEILIVVFRGVEYLREISENTRRGAV